MYKEYNLTRFNHPKKNATQMEKRTDNDKEATISGLGLGEMENHMEKKLENGIETGGL